MKTLQDISPCNGLQWIPTVSRFKREFRCSFRGL